MSGYLGDLIGRYIDHSKNFPDTLAYEEDFSGRKFTISDFVSLASDIQSKLTSSGVKKNDIVVIKLGRTVEHMASRLAVMSMGAVCLPIEPDVPEGRYRMMTEGLNVGAVIDSRFFPVAKSGNELFIEEMNDDEPCFIIFTSGSTGRPKGILHPRGTILHLVSYMSELNTNYSGDMAFGTISNVSFIISWADFVYQLDKYSVNYLFDDNVRNDIRMFRERINRYGIVCVICNPNYYRMLGPDTCIKVVILAGERTGIIEEEGRLIMDCYGSSEVICAYRILNKEKDLRLFRSIPDGHLSVEDDNGNDAEEGELVYHGPGIMLGYLDGKIGDRSPIIYHTGDIARKVDDGFAIIGRKDSMVKINGQRVEPAETELVMCQVPGVSNAVVKSFDDCGTYLCAYYASEVVDEKEMRNILSSKLNHYQIPKYIKRVDSFQMNANGKIDRFSLTSLRVVEGCTEAPSEELEIIICKAFGESLGITNVGLDDDFIDFGGDSMRVMKMISSFDSMKTEDDMYLRPSDIMMYRTPRAISQNIRRLNGFDCKYDLKTGGPAPDSVKNGHILVNKYGENYFSLVVVISMDQWKDPSDAEKTVKQLIGMFPILSMRLEDRNGRLWMMFDRQPEIIRCEDDPKSLDVNVVARFGPYDDVSTRFIICKYNGKVSLLIAFSHLVFDGRSVRPIFEAMLKGRTSPDIGLIRQGAYDELLKGTDAYYKSKELVESYLKPVFSDEIPSLPKYDISSKGEILVPMDVSFEKVKDFAKECGVSITALLTVAFGIAKANFTKSEETTFSLVTGGRGAPGTEDSVGMFTKIVPIHIVRRDMGVKEYIRLCSSEISELLVHDEYQFCDMPSDPYSDYGFLFQYSDFLTSGPIPGVEAERLSNGLWVNNSSLSVVPKGDMMVVSLRYCVKYREEDIAELLCSFNETLEKMMTTERSIELFIRERSDVV